MNSDEVDYEVFGDDMQLVEVELDPGEVVIAEAGAMAYMEEDISYEARMGDGSRAGETIFQKVFSAGMRALTGESIFLTHFRNDGTGKRRVAFAAPYPGKIIPVDLKSVGGEIICQKDAFLCAVFGTTVDIVLNKRLGSGLFGGEGFILQRLKGDGKAFFHVGGTVIKRELHGETLRIDTGCIAAFTSDIDYSIEQAGNLKSMLFGGEGLFLATLRGHGTVWLQSLPFSRMADRVIRSSGAVPGHNKGENFLGRIGNFMGDR